MVDRNSVVDVKKWVVKSVNNSKMSDEVKEKMIESGTKAAEQGRWRGDISDMWKRNYPNVNGITIPDLYN